MAAAVLPWALLADNVVQGVKQKRLELVGDDLVGAWGDNDVRAGLEAREANIVLVGQARRPPWLVGWAALGIEEGGYLGGVR